jgi:hypothetical protein
MIYFAVPVPNLVKFRFRFRLQFRFRIQTKFTSSRVFQQTNLVQNLVFSMSEAAEKLASQFRFFRFYIPFMLDLDPNPAPKPEP